MISEWFPCRQFAARMLGWSICFRGFLGRINSPALDSAGQDASKPVLVIMSLLCPVLHLTISGLTWVRSPPTVSIPLVFEPSTTEKDMGGNIDNNEKHEVRCRWAPETTRLTCMCLLVG